MLDPDLVLSSIINAFRDIPHLVSELNNSPANIQGHSYVFGTDNSLARTIEQMKTGSILVAYQDLLGGNGVDAELWKHRLQIYIRPKNGGASPPHIFWLMFHEPLASSGLSIRYTPILGGALVIPNTPTLTFQQDAMLSDLFVSSLVFPELGDD